MNFANNFNKNFIIFANLVYYNLNYRLILYKSYE